MNKLNLGAGPSRIEDYITVDISSKYIPDVLCDIEKGLPFKTDSIDSVIACQVLEHMHDLISVMNEIWRVCKKNAKVIIDVPHQSSIMAYADPTHKRVFNEESIKYFCSNCEHYWIHESYKITANFHLISQKKRSNWKFGLKKRINLRIELRAIK